MTCVAQGHDGDAGDPGDPPGSPWHPPTRCQSSKVRGPTTNAKLHKFFRQNGQRPLPIEFDIEDQRTGRPVGDNASLFSNLVGTIVGDEIPKYYKSWDKVPEEAKTDIWPKIEMYFDMGTHMRGPHGRLIRAGVMTMCAERYRDRKSRFKREWFTEREGFEHPVEIRQFPPPNMPFAEWDKNVDFILDEANKKRSEVNTVNRSKQQYSSVHGTRSYAAIRNANRDPQTGQFPDLIKLFGSMHKRNHKYVNPIAESQHQQMEALRDSQSGTSTPMSDEAILSQVLGKRRGYNRGRGRKLSGVASTSSSSAQSKAPRLYTQRQVDAIVAAQNSQMSSIFNALRAANIPIPDFQPIDSQQFVNREDDEEDGDENDL